MARRSVFQRVASLLGAQKREASADPGVVPGSFRGPVDFGVRVTNDTALKVTAFYAGIRIISENIAALPKDVRRYTDRGPMSERSSDIYRLINGQPNAYTNAFSFWSVITTWVKGWGNAFAIIKRDGAGRPIELHQVHPAGVRITMVGPRKWYGVTMQNPDLMYLNGVYPDEDILHFMELTLDGLKGVNPVIYNAAALGKSIATETFAADFYRKGGANRGVMEYDGAMGDEAYEKFVKHYAESSGNFQVPLLEYGIKYRQLSIDPVASQLVQSETLSIQDVCRIINIPPHMVADLSRATFSNIEHQTIQFVQYSLRPLVKRFETELESKLFAGREAGTRDVKFILDGLLRGDTQARSQYYHNAILDGYMSRNEVRELEGYEHKEGLDEFLYPQNEGVVGQEGNQE